MTQEIVAPQANSRIEAKTSDPVVETGPYDLLFVYTKMVAKAINTVAPTERIGYGASLIAVAQPQNPTQHMPAIHLAMSMPSGLLNTPLFCTGISPNLAQGYDEVLNQVRDMVEQLRAARAEALGQDMPVRPSGSGLFVPGRG